MVLRNMLLYSKNYAEPMRNLRRTYPRPRQNLAEPRNLWNAYADHCRFVGSRPDCLNPITQMPPICLNPLVHRRNRLPKLFVLWRVLKTVGYTVNLTQSLPTIFLSILPFFSGGWDGVVSCHPQSCKKSYMNCKMCVVEVFLLPWLGPWLGSCI